MKKFKYAVGVDEVGRGPIAGPVTVCAFLLSFSDQKRLINKFQKENNLPIKDSKKLNQKQREEWLNYLNKKREEGECDFAIFSVSNTTIDRCGIERSLKRAVNSSLKKINKDKKAEEILILLDGRLKADERYLHQKTIVRGDENEPIISLASIVAKVTRDNLMKKFSEKYPEYHFETNVGYGTKKHYEAIEKFGISPLHRKTFLN